ncbi:unnamed protein product [Rotaria socialis]|uniref:RING-type domain-containing protein n=1 Tax=Rotaria socialis TaxID=392032 RepID=A0A821BUB6_9BILA|nr:unnamed protein product [Rotaria socialis]
MNFSNNTYQTQSNQNSTADDEGGLILHTCRDVTIPPIPPMPFCIGSIGIVRCWHWSILVLVGIGWYWYWLVLVLVVCSNHANCPATTIEDQNDQNLTNSEEQYGQDSGDCIGQVQDTAEIQILIGPSIILTGQDAFISNCSDKLFENLDEKTNVPTSSFNQPQCVKDQPSEDRRLPENVIALFPGQSEQEIRTKLKNVQDAKDKIWNELDKKFKKRVMSRETTGQMYKDVTQSLYWHSIQFREQANAVYKAQVIMENILYGFMFCNTKNEVLAVQNHHGTRSALKGHPKIKEDGTLETRWETCLRELFEEVSIRYQGSKIHQRINKENICHLLHLKKDNYIQYRVDSNPDIGNKIRIIGLFIVSVNENEVKFILKDTKENKIVEWLKIDDIIQNNPGSRRDIYFTLRPFIKFEALKEYETCHIPIVVLTMVSTNRIILDDFQYMNESAADGELKCPICTRPFSEPVCSQSCRHIYGKACIKTWLNKQNVCPTCRSTASFAGFKPIETRNFLNMLNNLLVQCKHCKQINIERGNKKRSLIVITRKIA